MFNLQATWDIWIWFDELHNNVVGTSWGLNEKEFQKFACGLPYLISPKWRQAATKILVSIVVVCCLEALSPNLIRCWLKVYPCGASQFLWGYYVSLDKTHNGLNQIFTKSSHKDLHQILQWVKRLQKLTLVVRERNNFAVNVHRIFFMLLTRSGLFM